MPGRSTVALAVAASVALAGFGVGASAGTRVARAAGGSPIKHIVVIFQENHSFDETLGAYCKTRRNKCDGFTGTVRLSDGKTVALKPSKDIVPPADHSVKGTILAINGGKMDGWDRAPGCSHGTGGCMTYYEPKYIPNLAALADHFTVADRAFSMGDSASWGGHLYAAAASLDGFTGDNPHPKKGGKVGWGCDSNKDAFWSANLAGTSPLKLVPSCVPSKNGSGAYHPTPVKYAPTIMDRLTAAGGTWNIYGAPVPTAAGGKSGGYGWSICPSFAQCRYTPEVNHLVPSGDILKAAANGTLADYSILTPSWSSNQANKGGSTSQHNNSSMLNGDNWIGKVVDAIQHGPDWKSTAIFITYDDCGCFYDHVSPPKNPDGTQQGPRVPMVIVSPYARAGYTDSHPSSFASILAFAEKTFHLAPLSANDKAAYDYSSTFNYGQTPTAPVRMVRSTLPASTWTYLRTHANEEDDDDVT